MIKGSFFKILLFIFVYLLCLYLSIAILIFLEKMKKSLTESAKEYESRQVKRKFDEVAVITGEEEESNVLQVFTFHWLFLYR